ncbi:GAF and ANTAR domain-containing protein [Kitasatospora purpeofusca]|uniref:GAF and ANTAR domain-containing protein n=1 Tax=Kitasatospora purpeofusca TaxID=67352 RepID=UPI002A5A03FC|nr:GAF and ANTAR domain-containing protein [Kitasatospora purpeofusca]MDY0814545.1 GAF and ANTAR domain-containing protein [Kitasatospora purpeofusca]
MSERARAGRILADAVAREDGTPLPERLCAACVQALSVTGAVIALTGDGDAPPHALFASDSAAASAEELQFTLGEGPSVEALRTGVPVLAYDLPGPGGDRWPVLSSTLPNSPPRIATILASPLRLHGSPFGVLSLHRDHDEPFRREDLDAVQVAVDTSALALLAAFEAAPGLPPWLETPGPDGVEVDQAVGMIMVQLAVPAETALARLRARAFAEGASVGTLAHEVVARRLRFTDDRTDNDRQP